MNQYFILPLAVVATVMSFLSCRSGNTSETEADKPVPVIAEKVQTDSVLRSIDVSGNIEGFTTVKLGFMVAGKISHIAVAEGRPVSKGSLLATLDAENYRIAKEIADIQVLQATDEFNRLKQMYDRNSLSESDFKKIDFALQAAIAQQKLHAKNLSETRLYAPINGILLKKLAEVGEITASGMPVLVISDISRVKVNAYIPENRLSEVKIGQQAKVYIAALDKTYTGKVTEVGGMADPATRAFTVKIEVSNPGNVIRPGMIAEISIPSLQSQPMVAIPASAILRTPEGQSYVFIADAENQQAFVRNISIGSAYGEKIAIVSGLNTGEMIITGGQHKLSNGTRISISHP